MKHTQKTTMQINIKAGKICHVWREYAEPETDENGERKTTGGIIKGKTWDKWHNETIKKRAYKKTVWCNDIKPIGKPETLTDYAGAVITENAFRCAVSTLKKIYSISAQPDIYRLLIDVVRLWRSVSPDTVQESTFDDGDTMQTVKLHTYTVKTVGGRRYKLEIIPYYDLQETEEGKEYLRTAQIPDDVNGADIVSVAQMALVEIIQTAQIDDIYTLSHYRHYVHNRINAYITAQRKQSATTESLDAITEIWNDKTETVNNVKTLYGNNASRAIERVLMNGELRQAVKAYLLETMTKAQAKMIDRHVKIVLLKIAGYTKYEIADKIGVDEKIIRRSLLLTESLLTLPNGREMLSSLF